MRRKSSKQLFSVLMATAMVMSGISVPVMASPVDDAMVQSALAEAGVETSESREINFNKGWKFHFGDVTGAEAKDYDDSKADEWGDLNLPHDFSITQEPSNSNEAESGFMPGGTGWYRKSFTLPSDYAGKSVVLNFDGSYNHTYVYVNGTKVGENHYGYNDFAFDISKYLTCDGTTENVISVKVVHQTPSRQVLCRDPHALQAGRLREGPHHGQRGVRPRGHARRRGSDELIRPKRITQKASRVQETGALEAFVVFGRRARKKVNTSFGENWK